MFLDMEQENIDAKHQWLRKSVVSEIEHIAAYYIEFSNRLLPNCL